jgi:hypothetical protein
MIFISRIGNSRPTVRLRKLRGGLGRFGLFNKKQIGGEKNKLFAGRKLANGEEGFKKVGGLNKRVKEQSKRKKVNWKMNSPWHSQSSIFAGRTTSNNVLSKNINKQKSGVGKVKNKGKIKLLASHKYEFPEEFLKMKIKIDSKLTKGIQYDKRKHQINIPQDMKLDRINFPKRLLKELKLSKSFKEDSGFNGLSRTEKKSLKHMWLSGHRIKLRRVNQQFNSAKDTYNKSNKRKVEIGDI